MQRVLVVPWSMAAMTLATSFLRCVVAGGGLQVV
jgi:hypothetical protein